MVATHICLAAARATLACMWPTCNEGIPQMTVGCILHGRPLTVLAPLDNVPPTGSPPQSKLPVGSVDLSQSEAESHEINK